MSTYSLRGIHGQLVDMLGLRILSGQLPPGTVVDPDALIAEFGVSRTVVREVFKVLAAKGLMDARPRTGTFITNRARWQLLDADVMSWRSRGANDPLLLLELGEVRQVIEPMAARMAASRRSPEQVDEMQAALDEMARWGDDDEEKLISADLKFHRLVLLAAGNELLQRFEVILEPALQARNALLHHHSADRTFLNAHIEVLKAIASSDADAAQGLMANMMAMAAHDAESALAQSERGSAVLKGRIRAI